MATAWLAFLGQLSVAEVLGTNATIDISDTPGWLGIITADNDMQLGIVPPQESLILSAGVGIITLELENRSCVVTIEVPQAPDHADFGWERVTHFSNLNAQPFSTHFTVAIYYTESNGYPRVAVVNGTGCASFQLAPCNFPRVCGPNQLARDVQDLWNMVHTGTGVTSTGVALDTYFPPTSPESCQELLGNSIKGPFEPGNLAMTWTYVSAGPSITVQNAYQSPSPRYRFDIIEALPMSFDFTASAWSGVAYFGDINADHENFFVITGFNINGVQVVELRCRAWLDAAGGTFPVEMGQCELPDNPTCTAFENTLSDQIAAVIEDIVYRSPLPPANGSSPFISPNMTDALANYFCGSQGITIEGVVHGQAHIAFNFACFDGEHGPCGEALNVLVPLEGGMPIGAGFNVGAANYFWPSPDGVGFAGMEVPFVPEASHTAQMTLKCGILLPCDTCRTEKITTHHLLGLPEEELIAQKRLKVDSIWLVYLDYKAAIDSFNTRLALVPADDEFVSYIPYGSFRSQGSWQSVEVYTHYLRHYKPGIDEHARAQDLVQFVLEQSNARNAKEEYLRYSKAVYHYNTRAAALGQPTIEAEGDSLFRAMLLADDLAGYVDMLFVLEPRPESPASLLAWSEVDGNDPCVVLYREDYLPAYASLEAVTTDSTGRCPGFQKYAPLISFKEFEDAKVCCSDSGLVALQGYLEYFTSDSAKCPGEIPRLKDCAVEDISSIRTVLVPDKECQRLYQYWRKAVITYMGPPPVAHQVASRTNLELSYDTYEAFLAAGLCDCAREYLGYFEPYLVWKEGNPELPTLLSITEFCSGAVKPCKDLYLEYLQAIKDYNESLFAAQHAYYLEPDADSFEKFEFYGYCLCVAAYLEYLAGYTAWTNSTGDWPPPLSIKKFCVTQGDPNCKMVYHQYVAELISWQPTLIDIFTEYGTAFTFSIPSYEEYEQLGLCYCVPGYLARLQAQLGVAIDNVNLWTLQWEFQLWNILKYCEIPQPCPPQEPYLPTPRITYPQEDPCVTELLQIATMNAEQAFDSYIQERANDIMERYRELCLSAQESFQLEFPNSEYHHTLYYYDQAGSLIRTVPPQGVLLTEITQPSDSIAARIAQDRANGTQTYFTRHGLVSDHVYNSLGQPIRSGMPDQDARAEWSLAQPLGLPNEFISQSVSFAGAKGLVTGYRVGTQRGLAYATHDGGRTWQRSLGLLAADLHGGHFPSSTTGYAVGDDGTLVKTADGGATWDLVQCTSLLDLRPHLYDAYFSSTTAGILVGQQGTGGYAGRTTDGGLNVTSLALQGNRLLTGVGRNGADIVIGGVTSDGSNGVLYTATNAAGPWNEVPLGRTAAHLLCGQAVDADSSYLGGERGVLLRSSNTGGSWATRPTDTGWDFIDMAWRDMQNGIAILDSAGVRGVLRHTVDSGRTWQPIVDMPNVDMTDLFLYQSGNTAKVLAIGNNGQMARIFVGDSTLGFAQANGPAGYNAKKCWAGYSGSDLVAVITDGSANMRWALDLAADEVDWQVLTAPAAVHELVAYGYNDQIRLLLRTGTQYCVGALTLPQGTALFDAPLSNDVIGISLRANGVGLVVRSGADPIHVALNVVNLPITWATYDPGVVPSIQANAVFTLDGITEAIVGDDGSLHVAKINDVGNFVLWTDRSAEIQPLPIRAVHKDGTLAACDQGTVLVGSGSVWTAHPTRATTRLNGVERLGANSVVAVGEDNTAVRYDLITRTPEVLPVPASGELHAATAVNGSLYVAADAGRVLRTTDPAGAQPTWLTLDHNSAAVNALLPVGNGNVYAVGGNALVHAFAGTNRMVVHDVFLPKLNATWLRDGLTAYVVGGANTARYTNNGGQTWQVVPVGGALRDLRCVQGNLQVAYAGGTGKRLLSLDAGLYEDVPMPASGSASTELRSLAVSGGGGLLVAAADGATGRWYTRDGNDNWATGATSTPLNATWAFPRFVEDVVGVLDENSHEDLVFGGDGGLIGIKRYSPFTEEFLAAPSWSSTIQVDNGGNTAVAANIKAFWFHDQIAGYALVTGPTGIRILKTLANSSDLSHASAFTWNTSSNDMVLPLSQQPYSGSLEDPLEPRCIGFPDRGTGFVGGYHTPASNGFVRLLTDEGGLYSQRFWYDALGRLVLSQNSKQSNLVPQRFSYSLYDELGRVYEAGELLDGVQSGDRFRDLPATEVNGALLPQVIDPEVLKTWVHTRPRFELTRTKYDEPLATLNIPGFTQQHLRLRVASTMFYENEYAQPTPNEEAYDHATHYSYDIHGNVNTLIQDHPQLGTDGGAIAQGCNGCIDHRYKRMDYRYDLISGNVRQVDYQRDQPDRFHHRYEYDADNRIIEVETSADGQNWHRDARYFYYPHGPLERVELGQHLVQGMDYAYTLQGWLKGINGDRLNPTTDMGRDGDPTMTNNPNVLAGRDAYALSLGYYGDADYKAITGSWNNNSAGNIAQRPFAPIGTTGTMATEHVPLYNGNIAHTVNTLQPFGLWTSTNGDQGQVLAQVYRYDQLNRLKKARGVSGLGSSNTWDAANDPATNKYRSQYEYDANGNILSAERYDQNQEHYDSFSYKYEKRGNRVVRNRLYQLNDVVDEDNDWVNETGGAQDIAWTGDVPFNEEDPNINTAYNYGYDALGNLIRDNREGITNIDWTVAGKVRGVTKATGPSLSFHYGASGQRSMKQVGNPTADDDAYREHYIRDAQGNIMATYRYELLPVPNTPLYEASLKLAERPIYGSSRLGSFRKQEELFALPTFDPLGANPIQQADLNYELTDHLGNVTAVVTGRLLDGNGGGTPKQAELLSAQGYESFGSLLPGRNYSSDAYRFGFQGQEKDDEMHGSTGTSINYKYRMHDARIGRFLSIDPLAAKYPHNSPYAFSENRVIDGVELEGLEVVSVHADARGFLGVVTGAVAGGVMFDREGFAGYITPGVGVGLGAGGSLGAGISVSGADWIENAAGPGWSIGGNLHVGVGLEVSVDGNIGQYTYGGATVAVGGGAEAGIFGELNWTFTTKKTTYMDIARMAMGSNATQADLTTKAREVFSSFKTNALSQINTAISTRQTEMSTLCGELNCLQNNGGDSDAIRRTNDRMGTLQKEIGALGQQRDVISSMEYEER